MFLFIKRLICIVYIVYDCTCVVELWYFDICIIDKKRIIENIMANITLKKDGLFLSILITSACKRYSKLFWIQTFFFHVWFISIIWIFFGNFHFWRISNLLLFKLSQIYSERITFLTKMSLKMKLSA